MNDRHDPVARIHGAEVVLTCADLDETLAFFTGRLGFRLEGIFPADDPAESVVSGHGLRIRLRRGKNGGAAELRIACEDPLAVGGGASTLIAPNGTTVELVAPKPSLQLPELRPSFSLSALAEATWIVGRAGMRYRDLIADRQGGRYVASHIRIPDGGPVADYVHYHEIRFQLIYCTKGWVRVVYEDQGPPFVLEPGDCVLQPPRIRHRVLESSPGLEVVEVACPARHETWADHDLELPTAEVRVDRDFGGQRFVRHLAAEAPWGGWTLPGFEARDTGIAAATGGLVTARAVRRAGSGPGAPAPFRHEAELCFCFVVDGGLDLEVDGNAPRHLVAGDAVVVPPRTSCILSDASEDLRLLEVVSPSHQG